MFCLHFLFSRWNYLGYGNIEEYRVRFVGEGIWWHDEKQSCMEADFSIYDASTNELLKKFHEQSCNKILKLNSNKFTYKDDKGIVHEMFLYSKAPNKSIERDFRFAPAPHASRYA
jgi:hypothetical protein